MIARLRQLRSSKFIQDIVVVQAGRFGLILLALISTVVVFGRLGPQRTGDFALAESFLAIWQSLDMTGAGTATSVLLAIAIGARDDKVILDLMGYYVKVTLAVNIGLTLLIIALGATVARLFYNGNMQIVTLAIWLSVGSIADGMYELVIIALQSRRSMRSFTLMQNMNQLVLTISQITAALISPTAESLVVGRLFWSYSTLLIALVVYERVRAQGQVSYPSLKAIFARARSVSARPYWRFGVANAVDKNVVSLFIQVPVQLVGIFVGARAVGYLDLAMGGIRQASVLTSAVLNNVEVIVPQAVGRKDFAGLWRNFTRVLVVMLLGSLVFFTAMVVAAPLLIPPIFGARWIPAIAPLEVLAIYGAITTVGGLLTPLYRTFNQMWPVIGIKVIALVLVLPLGALWLMRLNGAWMAHFVGTGLLQSYAGSGGGAVTGAWIITGLYAVSITLTAAITLPELRKRAR